MNNTTDTRTINIDINTAKEWYNSGNETLKELALQAFKDSELGLFDFTKIKTFRDALLCLYKEDSYFYKNITSCVGTLKLVSKASAAMFMLNIVRKVLNTGYDLHLTKNTNDQDYTWYPYLRLTTKDSTFYNERLKNGDFKKLGKIVSEGVTYNILGGRSYVGGGTGLGYFDSDDSVCNACTDIGFLGCATDKIANHLGTYFGHLILEAMYGDMIDFKILD